MSRAFYLTTAKGVPMVVVLGDYRGEVEGELSATHGPVVSFWDLRYHFDPVPGTDRLGQFTGGCYYAKTLLASPDGGLTLHGGEPAWDVDAASYRAVLEWLVGHVGVA